MPDTIGSVLKEVHLLACVFFFREQVNMLDPLTSTLLRSGMKIRCRKVFFMLNAATLRYKLGARRLAMCSSVFKFADPLPK